MNRRDFIRSAGLLSLSLMMPQANGWAWAAPGAGDPNSSRLVVIFLRGAADGLNILVPYSDPAYYSLRPTIAIPKPGAELGALDLDGSFGLHPSLAPILPLWKSKSLAFVTCSGSPDPTRSHFDAQDYMESGVPGNKITATGWLNRLLSQLPDNKSPIRAINVGNTMPRILQGPISVASYEAKPSGRGSALDRPMVLSSFAQMYDGRTDELGKSFAEAVSARKVLNSRLQDEMLAADQGAPLAKNFRGFGQQLGRLFHQEPATRVAFIALGGFDTHVNQGASKGVLANNLATLGTGLSEFVTGLGPAYERTIIAVVSEFGRTVKENGNSGTDHGHGNVIWLLGGPVAGGKVYGKWDGLAQRTLFEGRDLPVTTDFRSVMSAMIEEHMKIDRKGMSFIFPDFANTDKSVLKLLRA